MIGYFAENLKHLKELEIYFNLFVSEKPFFRDDFVPFIRDICSKSKSIKILRFNVNGNKTYAGFLVNKLEAIFFDYKRPLTIIINMNLKLRELIKL